MRRGRDYLLVTNGIVGTAGFGNHKHNDLLGFEYHVDGAPVLVDPGSYVYTSDPDARNLFRSTACHNTLCVDGVEQNELRAEWLFRMFEQAAPEHIEVGEDDGGYRYRGRHHGYARAADPVVHERAFTLARQSAVLEIQDVLLGQGTHRLRWHFHFAPGVDVLGRARRHRDHGRGDGGDDCSRRPAPDLERRVVFAVLRRSPAVRGSRSRRRCAHRRPGGVRIPIDVMTMPGPLRSKTALAWATRLLIGVAIAAIALQWVNSRVTILRQNQAFDHPLVLSTYPAFHAMAMGLHDGHIGQVDLPAFERYWLLRDPTAVYARQPATAEHRWVNYYALDIGYSFIVEVARLAFPSLPDTHLRSLALQLVVDAMLVAFVGFVFWQWHAALGLAAAYLYASNGPFYDLVSFAYYYYWDIPLTFFVLGALLLAYRRPSAATPG